MHPNPCLVAKVSLCLEVTDTITKVLEVQHLKIEIHLKFDMTYLGVRVLKGLISLNLNKSQIFRSLKWLTWTIILKHNSILALLYSSKPVVSSKFSTALCHDFEL